MGLSVRGLSVRRVYVLGVGVRGVHVRGYMSGGGYVLEPCLAEGDNNPDTNRSTDTLFDLCQYDNICFGVKLQNTVAILRGNSYVKVYFIITFSSLSRDAIHE